MNTNQDGLGPMQRGHLVRLTPEDWTVWRSLRLRALAEAPSAFCATLAEWQGPGDTEARWRARLTSVPFNLVATLDGEFVGMVSATEKTDDGTVELISLWVAPAGRGHGVGDLLVDAVISWAKQQGGFIVALDVKQDNEHAKTLYLRRGFIDAGGESNAEPTVRGRELRLVYALPGVAAISR